MRAVGHSPNYLLCAPELVHGKRVRFQEWKDVSKMVKTAHGRNVERRISNVERISIPASDFTTGGMSHCEGRICRVQSCSKQRSWRLADSFRRQVCLKGHWALRLEISHAQLREVREHLTQSPVGLLPHGLRTFDSP